MRWQTQGKNQFPLNLKLKGGSGRQRQAQGRTLLGRHSDREEMEETLYTQGTLSATKCRLARFILRENLMCIEYGL